VSFDLHWPRAERVRRRQKLSSEEVLQRWDRRQARARAKAERLERLEAEARQQREEKARQRLERLERQKPEQERKAAALHARLEERRSRDAVIIAACRQGVSTKAIAAQIGVSRSRMSQILTRLGEAPSRRRDASPGQPADP
jgi:DNA-directed RNA polymerase specialized sigma subunit